jgi:hypothetical protein
MCLIKLTTNLTNNNQNTLPVTHNTHNTTL